VFVAFASTVVGAGSSAAERPGNPDARGALTAESIVGIGGSSACPRPDAVWAELETLIPREDLAGHVFAESPSSSLVEILDLGPRYRVIAGGRVREYRDDAHDCDHRARVAAVFVALSLAPGYFGQPVVAAPVSLPGVPSNPSPPTLTMPRSVYLDVGASYTAGLSGDHHAAPGITVRLALTRVRWGFVVGATVPLPTDATVNGLRVREFRPRADAGLRARLRTEGVEVGGEAGLTVAWLSEHAPDLAMSTAGTTIELGARGGLTVRSSSTARLAPFLSAHCEFVPRPTSLWALPGGHVGDSPMFWVGATAGVSLGW
jgi:hypothetical protein